MHEVDFKIPCWYTCTTQKDDYDCRKICTRYKVMNFLIVNCGMRNADRYLKGLIPSKEDKLAFDDLANIKAHILEFVNNGENLFIASDKMQNGKTTWSLKMLYKYFDEIWIDSDFVPRGYFIYVPDFLQKLRSFEYKNTTEYKEIDKILNTADLVIWDDITLNPLLPSDQAILNGYLSKRIQRGLSNICNGLNRTDLRSYLGDDITMRVDSFMKIILRGEPGRKSSIKLKSEKKFKK